MPLQTTHLFTVRDRRGVEIAAAEPVRSFSEAVELLADGDLVNVDLVSVHRVVLTAGIGTTEDVTARVLHAVAAYVDADEREVRSNLLAAFAAYDVPVPAQPPADWADVDAEHRLCAADCLPVHAIGGRL